MSKYNLKDIDPKDIRIKPRCLTYEPKSYHKPAAYTADGFMLPCCWLDDPKNDHGVEEKFHLKYEELALKNNVKRIIQTSTSEVFGNTKFGQKFKES